MIIIKPIFLRNYCISGNNRGINTGYNIVKSFSGNDSHICNNPFFVRNIYYISDRIEINYNAMSIEDQILKKIRDNKRGKIFFPANFSKIGSIDAIHQSLKRLEEKGIIVRLAYGIYLYPKVDKELGILYPPIDVIAKAIAKRDRARIIPTGIQALNKLGLSTQVTMKVVYLTDGAQRSIKIGNQSIKFKKSSPKNLSSKGEISGLVIQALREIGIGKVSEEQKSKIIELLKKEDPENVKYDARLAPAWISEIMQTSINPQ
jgi:hypothetical protein